MLGLTPSNRTRAEFEVLALPLLDGLYAAALRLTHNERDAEDLVQDAFMRAYRFFDRFQRGTNFRAWMFKILTNTFINQYRRNVKARSLEDESERDSVQAQFFSGQATEQARNPEAWLLDRAFTEDVLAAIDLLPIDFRMVVILADLQEFSYKEIADILEVPVGTVMSRLFRGRKLLQKRLGGYDGQGPAVQPEEAGPVPVALDAYRARKKTGTSGV
jgi:RNA polymerase sigma-70 factor, ECF subfamily